MGDESTAVAEKLVATVARAFYPDNYVVLFDALVREKYIRQEELGPRLKLPNEEVRKMVVQLEKERMLSCEERLMESDLRRSQCYYLDYQHFVHVVRYRIHVMQKEMTNSENVELNRHFLICPTCQTKFSELQYYKVRDKNNVFICPHCCPLQNIRSIESEKFYQLVEYDRTEKVNEVQSLLSKFKNQLGRSEGHEGIYELLAQLRDVHVTRNLPSENIEQGNVASRVLDADVQSQIDYNNVGIKAKKLSKQQQEQRRGMAGAGGDFKVEFAEEKAPQMATSAASGIISADGVSGGRDAGGLDDEPAAKRPRALPSFLQGSRIREEAVSVGAEGTGAGGHVVSAGGTQEVVEVVSGDVVKTETAAADNDDEDLWED